MPDTEGGARLGGIPPRTRPPSVSKQLSKRQQPVTHRKELSVSFLFDKQRGHPGTSPKMRLCNSFPCNGLRTSNPKVWNRVGAGCRHPPAGPFSLSTFHVARQVETGGQSPEKASRPPAKHVMRRRPPDYEQSRTALRESMECLTRTHGKGREQGRSRGTSIHPIEVRQ